MAIENQKISITEDEGETEVLTGVYYQSIDVSKPVRMTQAPIETGTTTFDGKVIDPPMLTIKCIARKENYQNAVNQMNVMYSNKTYKFYTIRTKEAIGDIKYTGYALVDWSHREVPEMIDAIEYTLKFKKVFMLSFSSKTKDKADAKTVKSGNKSTK